MEKKAAAVDVSGSAHCQSVHAPHMNVTDVSFDISNIRVGMTVASYKEKGCVQVAKKPIK